MDGRRRSETVRGVAFPVLVVFGLVFAAAMSDQPQLPQLARRVSTNFSQDLNQQANDLMHDLDANGIGTILPAATGAADTTGVGGSQDSLEMYDDDEEEEEEEEEESEADFLSRMIQERNEAQAFRTQILQVNLTYNDASVKALVELKPELEVYGVKSMNDLKDVLGLSDGDKLNAGLIRGYVKQRKREAYDAALPRIVQSDSQFDPFEVDDDPNDPEHHGSSSDVNLQDMSFGQIQQLYVGKQTEVQSLKKELADKPIKVALKEFAKEHSSHEDEAKATMRSVRGVTGSDGFKGLDVESLKLLSTLAHASARTKELDKLIAFANAEVDKIKPIYLNKVIEKDRESVEKKVSKKARRL